MEVQHKLLEYRFNDYESANQIFRISVDFCMWPAFELTLLHKLKSHVCEAAAQEQPLSPDIFHRGISLASDWFEHGITSSKSFLPIFLFVQTVIPPWWECRVRPLLLLLLLLPCVLLLSQSHIFLWYVCLCLMASGWAKGSHWLTGGFDSLAFAEAVNHQLSIATVGHSFGHPFVCGSSAL